MRGLSYVVVLASVGAIPVVQDCAPEIGDALVISLDEANPCAKAAVSRARDLVGPSARVSRGVDLRGDDATSRSNLEAALRELGVDAAATEEAVEAIVGSTQPGLRAKAAVTLAHAHAWLRTRRANLTTLVLEEDSSLYDHSFARRFCHLWKRRPPADYYQLQVQVPKDEGCTVKDHEWRNGTRPSTGAYVLTPGGAATLIDVIPDYLPSCKLTEGCPVDILMERVGLKAQFLKMAPSGEAAERVGNGVVKDGEPKWKYVVDQCGLIYQDPTCGSAREDQGRRRRRAR